MESLRIARDLGNYFKVYTWFMHGTDKMVGLNITLSCEYAAKGTQNIIVEGMEIGYGMGVGGWENETDRERERTGEEI